MNTKKESFAPGIVVRDKCGYEIKTIYPTGNEWILAFALKGCKWAIDLIESGQLEKDQATLWLGENI